MRTFSLFKKKERKKSISPGGKEKKVLNRSVFVQRERERDLSCHGRGKKRKKKRRKEGKDKLSPSFLPLAERGNTLERQPVRRSSSKGKRGKGRRPTGGKRSFPRGKKKGCRKKIATLV